jgi:hypothetical protein
MSRAATHHIPLNLKMDPASIRTGKNLARLHGMSVSCLISEVFEALDRLEREPVALHPLLEQLAGIAQDSGQARQDVVMAELERKYGAGTGS